MARRDYLSPEQRSSRPAGWLYGWKEIAGYIGCSVKTAIHYSKVHHLPVVRLHEKPMGSPQDIDRWIQNGGRPFLRE